MSQIFLIDVMEGGGGSTARSVNEAKMVGGGMGVEVVSYL